MQESSSVSSLHSAEQREPAATAPPRSVLIAANPIAGARSSAARLAELTAELEAAGCEVTLLHDIEEITRQARTLYGEGRLAAVVAAGGDGTVRLVVDRTEEGVPIAILPQGTENLLVRQLELPWEPKEIAQAIVHGNTLTLDAGRANGCLFLLMIGAGFDAEVVERVHRDRRGHITHRAYIRPILSAIRRYRYPKMRIHIETGSEQETGSKGTSYEARWAFVMNMPHYALRLPIAPQADSTDGFLDVCSFAGGSLLKGLYYLSRVAVGRHHLLSACTMSRATRVRIEADKPVAYQMDGDPGGYLPLEIEIVPGRLKLIVPPAAT